jgi:hypothetical protein
MQDTITNEDIKKAGITRKDLAVAIGITYGCLSMKMNGFLAWRGDEVERCQAYLKKMGKRKS